MENLIACHRDNKIACCFATPPLGLGPPLSLSPSAPCPRPRVRSARQRFTAWRVAGWPHAGYARQHPIPTRGTAVPIRPELRYLYPIDWPEVSRWVRFVRARGRCEVCRRPHGRTVLRLDDGR